MLKFFVRDMLDFQQMKGKKMKKDISKFNVFTAINEVISMQKYIADKNNISIKVEY
jgi:hypothetical protein